jgi:hypothetical protein
MATHGANSTQVNDVLLALQLKSKSSPFTVWCRVKNSGIVTPRRGGARWTAALNSFAPGFAP